MDVATVRQHRAPSFRCESKRAWPRRQCRTRMCPKSLPEGPAARALSRGLHALAAGRNCYYEVNPMKFRTGSPPPWAPVASLGLQESGSTRRRYGEFRTHEQRVPHEQREPRTSCLRSEARVVSWQRLSGEVLQVSLALSAAATK
ncbi:unnamed protein product [Cladocopium goreaui]|uniref:Uncharacterized protein n=1 Tax=Cladocopium goreaui TaxID=2562237 RepID=A0A9P1DGR5_9DINO|nr:unnamed protein product [Cladocopium goreaui]